MEQNRVKSSVEGFDFIKSNGNLHLFEFTQRQKGGDDGFALFLYRIEVSFGIGFVFEMFADRLWPLLMSDTPTRVSVKFDLLNRHATKGFVADVED